MIAIRKNVKKWNVIIPDWECPNIYYPSDYHGCKILPDDNDRCTFENCPNKIIVDKEDVQDEQ